MSFWLPQNLQKRLLLYAVQQISLLSNVDLSNLHVSLGSNSQFTFDDLELAVDSLNVPGFEVVRGTIGHLDLELNVSGGVGVKGEGLLFELKPELIDRGPSFSLAKSIQDLTNSIIQLPDVASEMASASDMPEGSNFGGTSSSSASSSGEDDGAHTVGTLESMKNRFLNVMLSKLRITFDDIRIRVLLENEMSIDVSLGTFVFRTDTNSLRNVSITGFRISHEKKIDNKQDTLPNDRNDTKSITVNYPQVEDSSLYMSAMEDLDSASPKVTGGTTEGTVVRQDLLCLDYLDVVFEGLSSIDDLSARNFVIKVKEINIELQNLLALDNSIYELVIKVIQQHEQEDAPQTTSLAGYKRFQMEQRTAIETPEPCSIEIRKINLAFSGALDLSLRNVNFKCQENAQSNVSISSIELNGHGLSSVSESVPVMRGDFSSSELLVAFLHPISLSIDLQLLKQLVSVSSRVQEVSSMISKRYRAKRQPRSKSQSEKKVTIKFEPVTITLVLEHFKLSIATGPIFSDSFRTLFQTKSINVKRHAADETKNLLSCRNLSVRCSRSRIQIDSFDDKFNAALLTSKYVCQLDEVIFDEDFETVEGLCSDLKMFEDLFSKEDHDRNKSVRKSSMRKSVRILQSSSIMLKNTELAAFTLMLNSMKFTVGKFKSLSFGALQGDLSDILLAVTEDSGVMASCKDFSCARLSAGNVERVIEPLRFNGDERPLFHMYKKEGGKIKVKFRNLAFHYYARWLGILRKAGTSEKSKVSGKGTPEQLWEAKFLDCSFMLHPYRLSAALTVVADNLSLSAKSTTLQIKSLLKSGSLLLIDDYSSIKPPGKKSWPNLNSFYELQGFSAIGKIETVTSKANMHDPMISVSVIAQCLTLSLCADSAHTLTQLCIDLKFPLTFPDDQKYNYNSVKSIDVFSSVDSHFFSPLHIQEEPVINVEDDIVDLFEGHEWDFNQHSVGASSSDLDSQSIEMQESYLDEEQDRRSSPIKEESLPTDIIFDFEADKIIIKMFDGYDWKFTRRSISHTIDQVDQEIRALGEESSNAGVQLGMTVFDSIYVSANATDTVELKKRVNDEIQGDFKSPIYVRKANLHPSRHYKIAIQLEKLAVNFHGYSLEENSSEVVKTDPEQVNKANITIKRFEIIDNVPTSTWNKFLTLSRHGQWPMDRPMLTISLATFRPMSCLMATELSLNVEVAPLRLHVDQDALDFLVKFGEFKDGRFELIDEYPDIPFIQKLTTNSVKLKLDYKPKKVNYSGLRSGHASELMNFFILDGSSIMLKGIELYGINGFSELNTALKAVWTPDITSKQIPGVLEGFAPIKSLMALGSGVKALVSVPTTEPTKDRPLRSTLRRGCNVFVRTTTGDFVRLGAKLATGTQTVLENAEHMLGGDGPNKRIYRDDESALDMNHLLEEDQLVGGSNPRVKGHRPAALVLDPSGDDEGEPKIVSLYADQPLDIHKGLEEAYHSLEKHMHVVYDVVWKAKGELRENQASTAAAAVSVAKVAPVAIIRPLIGATEAVAKALQGISNQFDKEQINDINDKYKSLKGRKG